jgi:hypothetical protein
MSLPAPSPLLSPIYFSGQLFRQRNDFVASRPLLANQVSTPTAMRPTLDPASESKPDELPSDAKLQAGYIRYIRILPTEGPKGEVCFETCIRRSLSNDDSDEDRISKRLPYTAISYSWGDPTPSHPVIVDGQKRLVATNLWHFLQRANMQRVDLRQENSQRFEDVRAQQADWKSARFESPTAYLEFEDSHGPLNYPGLGRAVWNL